MTDRQSFALDNPVTDTDDPSILEKYAVTLTRGTRKFGTILTIDRVKNEFVWHVCVSLLDSEGRPRSVSGFSSTDKSVTARLARELLEDVGQPNSNEIRKDEKSVHMVRPTTIEEDRHALKAIAPENRAKKAVGRLRLN